MSEKNTVRKLDYSSLFHLRDGKVCFATGPVEFKFEECRYRTVALSGKKILYFYGESLEWYNDKTKSYALGFKYRGCRSSNIKVPSSFKIEKLPQICDLLDEIIPIEIEKIDNAILKEEEQRKKDEAVINDFFKQRLGKTRCLKNTKN